MDFDNYYEQFNGDEVIVHLDYLDPEPSLFQQSRGRGRRPSLNREYSPVLTSKQRLSRRRMTDAFSYNEYNDNHHFQRDDFRDDDVYEQMTARVAIQDQRYESNRSMGRQKLNSRENSISGKTGSGRSVVSRSTASSKKNINTKKSKFDLTGPDADSSFEVLATLIVEHLETKVVNSQYVLDKSDMDFFDAIIPETLRISFVEAVRFRSERLPSELEEDASNLQRITRKCADFGLASSDENNFLLGGGLRVQDKIIMKMVEKNQTNILSDGHDDDNHDFSVENSHVQEDDVEDIPVPSFVGTNLGSTTGGDKVKKQLPRNQKTKKISLQQKYLEHEHDDLPIPEDAKVPMDETLEKQGPKSLMDRPDFEDIDEIRNNEITVEKQRKKKKGERATRKKVPSHAAIMSVYSSPSTLDANVAAFEHEWRDGLWDVFTHGVCHPLVFLSFFAPIFALGQVMTRLKLNWIGIPSNTDDGKSIFPKLGTIFSIWLSVNILAICACTFAWIQMRSYIEAVSFLLVISNLWFFGFCVFVTGNTRQYIRDIYNIRDRGNSDYLLAAIYMPFTIAQMGRHTADYNSLQGRICSPTGLADDVDDSAIIENMNMYKSFNDDSETSSISLA